jgi:hypothetical protein
VRWKLTLIPAIPCEAGSGSDEGDVDEEEQDEGDVDEEEQDEGDVDEEEQDEGDVDEEEQDEEEQCPRPSQTRLGARQPSQGGTRWTRAMSMRRNKTRCLG